MAQAVIGMLERGASRIEVRKDVYEDYNGRLHEEASKLIYLTDAPSRDINYYVNEHGRLGVNVPWEADEYYRLSSEPELSEFVFSSPSRQGARPG
jgi:4-hydroxyacetophenone monooxygenase